MTTEQYRWSIIILQISIVQVICHIQGLIVTDSLAMQAITDVYTPGQAAVKALQAGADLLLMSNGLADAYTAVLEAVQDGTIPQQRLDESVQRILQCKYQYGILTQ